jgi:hypothetical protein
MKLQKPIPFVEMLPLNEAEPRQWEIDSLMRTRALEQVTSATLTLQVKKSIKIYSQNTNNTSN